MGGDRCLYIIGSHCPLTVVDGLGGLMIDANVVVVVEESSPEKSQ